MNVSEEIKRLHELHLAGALSDVHIYYDVGRALAMSTEWPNWYPTDAFRAIRDRSRAGQ